MPAIYGLHCSSPAREIGNVLFPLPRARSTILRADIEVRPNQNSAGRSCGGGVEDSKPPEPANGRNEANTASVAFSTRTL